MTSLRWLLLILYLAFVFISSGDGKLKAAKKWILNCGLLIDTKFSNCIKTLYPIQHSYDQIQRKYSLIAIVKV